MKRLRTSDKSSEAGFTLIELLVVIVIAGVLAAIAAPSWFAFANRQRATTVRSDITQLMRNAQQDAIQLRQARRVEVVTPSTNPTVRVGPLTFDNNGNPTFTGREELLGGEASSTGQITLEAYTVRNGTKDATVTNIAFDHRGLPINRNNLPFVITVNGAPGTTKQCVIVANLLGSLKTANGTECDNPRVALN